MISILITAPNLSHRLFALFCLVIGLLAVRALLGSEIPEPSRFLVHVPSGHSWQEVRDPLYGRDVTEYDFGGQVKECSYHTGSELRRCFQERDKAREFICDHWAAKKKAYIANYSLCADCIPVWHVFIEPDASGAWRIVTRHEDARFGVSPLPDAFGLRYRKPNPNERRLKETSSRVLSLLDTSGIEINAF